MTLEIKKLKKINRNKNEIIQNDDILVIIYLKASISKTKNKWLVFSLMFSFKISSIFFYCY